MTDADIRKLEEFYSIAATPLRIVLGVAFVGGILLATAAVLTIRALATPKD